jgi:hypothetical protein
MTGHDHQKSVETHSKVRNPRAGQTLHKKSLEAAFLSGGYSYMVVNSSKIFC